MKKWAVGLICCGMMYSLMYLTGCFAGYDAPQSRLRQAQQQAESANRPYGPNIPDMATTQEEYDALPQQEQQNISFQTAQAEGKDIPLQLPQQEEQWAWRLVNAAHPLPDDFKVETRPVRGYAKEFDVRAVQALEEMLRAAKEAGQPLHLVSAYRSIPYQKGLFRRKTDFYLRKGFSQAEAEKQAAAWVARPGTSEHHLGLAADLVSGDWYTARDDLTQEFETTSQFAWLQAHGAEYGFILRYPKGKEQVTGVVYEPWHYRYVGKAAAAYLTDCALTLEEFTIQQEENP